MANYNRVILAGNLTRDPELKYTPSNLPVCEFGLAINRKFRDRDNSNREEVCFVDVSAFGRSAEVIKQYMRKGQPMLVEGRLRYRQWTSKEGQKRSKLEVVVDNFQFLGGGPGGGDRSGGGAAVSDDAPPPPVDDYPSDPDVPF